MSDRGDGLWQLSEIYSLNLYSMAMHRSWELMTYRLDHLWCRFSLVCAIWHDDSETRLVHELPLTRYAALILRGKIHPGSGCVGRLVPTLAIESNWMSFCSEEKRHRVTQSFWDWRPDMDIFRSEHLITCIVSVCVSLYCRRHARWLSSNDYTCSAHTMTLTSPSQYR